MGYGDSAFEQQGRPGLGGTFPDQNLVAREKLAGTLPWVFPCQPSRSEG